MTMAATVESTSKLILDNVGGPENISSVTHCATRLRFHLHDLSLADQDAIDSDDKVLGVVPQGNTGLQVIMGGDVGNYYQGLMRQPGMGGGDGDGGSKASQSKKTGPKTGAAGKKENDGVKVLGNGELTAKLTVKAAKFSQSAIEKIEKAGGKAEVM